MTQNWDDGVEGIDWVIHNDLKLPMCIWQHISHCLDHEASVVLIDTFYDADIDSQNICVEGWYENVQNLLGFRVRRTPRGNLR